MKIDISNYNVLTGESTASLLKPATLMGNVKGADLGDVVQSAGVRIIDKATGAQEAVTESGNDGSYFVEFSGGKSYILEVTKEGFNTFSEEFSIPAGKIVSKDIILKKQ